MANPLEEARQQVVVTTRANEHNYFPYGAYHLMHEVELALRLRLHDGCN